MVKNYPPPTAPLISRKKISTVFGDQEFSEAFLRYCVLRAEVRNPMMAAQDLGSMQARLHGLNEFKKGVTISITVEEYSHCIGPNGNGVITSVIS